MFNGTIKYVRPVAGIAAFLVSFVIAVILLAKDYDEIMNRMLDREEYHLFLEIICGIIRYIATYVKAQLIIMSIISATAAVVLGISGIKHGVMWGLTAGLFDVLPFFGTGIVLIPLAIAQIFAGKYAKAVVCVALYGACAFMREMLEPRLIGRKIGVTPILVLISVYAGIKLFGGWGIIKGPLGFIIIYQSYLSITHKGILG
jgi:predicted PurR-regulated permease PerM